MTKKLTFTGHSDDLFCVSINGVAHESDDGRWVRFDECENYIAARDHVINELEHRIKELESEQHIWSIRNEARLLMIGHIVDDLENETDINKVKEYLEWQLNYYQKKVDNNEQL